MAQKRQHELHGVAFPGAEVARDASAFGRSLEVGFRARYYARVPCQTPAQNKFSPCEEARLLSRERVLGSNKSAYVQFESQCALRISRLFGISVKKHVPFGSLLGLFFIPSAHPKALAALALLLWSSSPPGSAAPLCRSTWEWRCASSRGAYSALNPKESKNEALC